MPFDGSLGAHVRADELPTPSCLSVASTCATATGLWWLAPRARMTLRSPVRFARSGGRWSVRGVVADGDAAAEDRCGRDTAAAMARPKPFRWWLASTSTRSVRSAGSATMSAWLGARRRWWPPNAVVAIDPAPAEEDPRRVVAQIEILGSTRTTNARTEAANVTMKNIKRTGRGYRSLANYRCRIMAYNTARRAG